MRMLPSLAPLLQCVVRKLAVLPVLPHLEPPSLHLRALSLQVHPSLPQLQVSLAVVLRVLGCLFVLTLFPADASGSGTLAPSAASGSAASGSASAVASGSASVSGSVITTAISASGSAGASGSQAGASGAKQTNTITATNSAPGSETTFAGDDGSNNPNNGTNSAAMGINAPVFGFAAIAVIAGSGLIL
ncbi:hypothetical protein BC629DRAFT_438854 [Irpex lacteus]|nr:hypothetical protein BC629DRAFT_438854 [Irpex lacteus]